MLHLLWEAVSTTKLSILSGQLLKTASTPQSNSFLDITNREGLYELLVNYRSGDMWAPQLEQVEALRKELSYFVDCIESGQEPFNDGCAGLRVVKMLEAASESLRERGALIYL